MNKCWGVWKNDDEFHEIADAFESAGVKVDYEYVGLIGGLFGGLIPVVKHYAVFWTGKRTKQVEKLIEAGFPDAERNQLSTADAVDEQFLKSIYDGKK